MLFIHTKACINEARFAVTCHSSVNNRDLTFKCCCADFSCIEIQEFFQIKSAKASLCCGTQWLVPSGFLDLLLFPFNLSQLCWSVQKSTWLFPQTHSLGLRHHFGQRDQVMKGGWMVGGANPSTVQPCKKRCTQLTSEFFTNQTLNFSFFLFSMPYKDLLNNSFIHSYLFEIADFHFWPCIENVLFF